MHWIICNDCYMLILCVSYSSFRSISKLCTYCLLVSISNWCTPISNVTATTHIAALLQNYVEHSYAGTQNSSGDEQLHLDIDCDNAVFRSIRDAGVFATAASEETPEETDVRPKSMPKEDEEGPWYSVGFDPLDGSSVIDANFSVGM